MQFSLELIISTAALGLSIYAVLLTKKHNQLSLVPHLDSSEHKERANEGTIFKLSIKNTGLGPAIIIDRYFMLDGRRVVPKNGNPIEQVLTACFAGNVHYKTKRDGLPGVGTIMPAGNELCIAEVLVPGLKAEQEPQVAKLTERADFVVVYESLHNQRFTLRTSGHKRPSQS